MKTKYVKIIKNPTMTNTAFPIHQKNKMRGTKKKKKKKDKTNATYETTKAKTKKNCHKGTVAR